MDNCPHCNVSLIGDQIPKEIQDHYSGTHWRREIGMEYPELYDGVWEWMCPDCKGTWPSEVKKLKHKKIDLLYLEQNSHRTYCEVIKALRESKDALNSIAAVHLPEEKISEMDKITQTDTFIAREVLAYLNSRFDFGDNK